MSAVAVVSSWLRRHALFFAAVALVVVAAVATLTSAPGELIADARYEHFAEPTQFLQRHASLWDAERSLGAPTKYFSPVIPLVQAAAENLGAAPWVIQRLTHALMLAVAGSGLMRLAIDLGARRRTAVLAAFVYSFNPFTSQFLVPSGLFMGYVAAPWLAWSTYRGLAAASDRWRWAAVVALTLFSMGALNLPSVLLGAIPALAFAVYRVVTEPGRWRLLGGFGWRVGLLVSAALAPVLVVLSRNSEILRLNLLTTENPQTVAAYSSASETWRGLGFWLSYARFSGEQVRDQAIPYFTNTIVIAATFLAVLLAAFGLFDRRRRTDAVLGWTAAVSVVLMVGIFPPFNRTPFGTALGELFDVSVSARGFRSLYKAGAGLQLPLAILAAQGVWYLLHRTSQSTVTGRRVAQAAVASLLLLGLGIASFPFWTGQLYPSSDRLDAIPDYWSEAFEWFDEQPDDQGVLVLPSTARSDYRWGFVNDTLFDAHLSQPAVAARTLPQSTAAMADLTEAVEEYAAGSNVRPGVLGPVLRSMGVRWILLQNDLDWFAGGLPRPAQFDFIRADPALRLAATFGGRGQDTTATVIADKDGFGEARLTPIEVFEVIDRAGSGGMVYDSHVVVEGAGDSWPGLSSAGWLEHGVLYAGDVGDDGTRAFERAAAYVVTDGGQRRARRVANSQSLRSPMLTVSEDIGREVVALFDDPARQTVAERGPVSAVHATHFGRIFEPWGRAWRPANVLDGNPATAWASEITTPQTIDIEMGAVTELTRIEVTPFVEDGTSALDVTLVVTTDDGSVTSYDLEHRSGASLVELRGETRVTRLRLEVVRGEDVDGLVGLSDVRLVGPGGPLDTAEVLRTPGPLDPVQEADLLQELGHTLTYHVFSRLIGPGPQHEEDVMRRRFWAPGGGVEARAFVRIDAATPDSTIDALHASEISAVASGRYLDEPTASARSLLDGRIATAWQFDPTVPVTATITVPQAEIDEVQLWNIARSSLPFELSRMTEFALRLRGVDGTETVERVKLGDEPSCDQSFERFGGDVCIERIIVPVDPMVVTEVVIEPGVAEENEGVFARSPVQVADVRLLNDGEDLMTTDAVEPSGSCRPLFHLESGQAIEMRPTEAVSIDTLTEGMVFEACDSTVLDPGWQLLRGTPSTAYGVDGLTLSPVDADSEAGTHMPLTADSSSVTSRGVDVELAPGAVVVTDVPFDSGWHVDIDGIDASIVRLNAQVGMVAMSGGQAQIGLIYEDQRTYRLSWYLAATSIAVSLWLLLPRRRKAQA